VIREMKMELLGLDIDGCLVEPESKSISLEILEKLRSLNRTARTSSDVPQVFFCSGRPHGFIEALMRVCECDIPSVFENGTGLVMPRDFQVEPLLTSPKTRIEDLEELFASCQKWVRTHKLGRPVPGKVFTLSFYPVSGSNTTELAEKIQNHFEDIEGLVDVFVGPTSVDLVPTGVDKSVGVRRIADLVHIPLSAIGGIGDASNDLTWLRIVGKKGVPRNADPVVTKIADVVAVAPNVKGVMEILDTWFPRLHSGGHCNDLKLQRNSDLVTNGATSTD
jgi:hydroxymethylpyrimidine pyrophosphatase-like HAD family hydrolase